MFEIVRISFLSASCIRKQEEESEEQWKSLTLSKIIKALRIFRLFTVVVDVHRRGGCSEYPSSDYPQ